MAASRSASTLGGGGSQQGRKITKSYNQKFIKINGINRSLADMNLQQMNKAYSKMGQKKNKPNTLLMMQKKPPIPLPPRIVDYSNNTPQSSVRQNQCHRKSSLCDNNHAESSFKENIIDFGYQNAYLDRNPIVYNEQVELNQRNWSELKWQRQNSDRSSSSHMLQNPNDIVGSGLQSLWRVQSAQNLIQRESQVNSFSNQESSKFAYQAQTLSGRTAESKTGNLNSNSKFDPLKPSSQIQVPTVPTVPTSRSHVSLSEAIDTSVQGIDGQICKQRIVSQQSADVLAQVEEVNSMQRQVDKNQQLESFREKTQASARKILKEMHQKKQTDSNLPKNKNQKVKELQIKKKEYAEKLRKESITATSSSTNAIVSGRQTRQTNNGPISLRKVQSTKQIKPALTGRSIKSGRSKTPSDQAQTIQDKRPPIVPKIPLAHSYSVKNDEFKPPLPYKRIIKAPKNRQPMQTIQTVKTMQTITDYQEQQDLKPDQPKPFSIISPVFSNSSTARPTNIEINDPQQDIQHVTNKSNIKDEMSYFSQHDRLQSTSQSCTLLNDSQKPLNLGLNNALIGQNLQQLQKIDQRALSNIGLSDKNQISPQAINALHKYQMLLKFRQNIGTKDKEEDIQALENTAQNVNQSVFQSELSPQQMHDHNKDLDQIQTDFKLRNEVEFKQKEPQDEQYVILSAGFTVDTHRQPQVVKIRKVDQPPAQSQDKLPHSLSSSEIILNDSNYSKLWIKQEPVQNDYQETVSSSTKNMIKIKSSQMTLKKSTTTTAIQPQSRFTVKPKYTGSKKQQQPFDENVNKLNIVGGRNKSSEQYNNASYSKNNTSLSSVGSLKQQHHHQRLDNVNNNLNDIMHCMQDDFQ